MYPNPWKGLLVKNTLSYNAKLQVKALSPNIIPMISVEEKNALAYCTKDHENNFTE
jgi:hypothetical protein